jgi:hypothetical protein
MYLTSSLSGPALMVLVLAAPVSAQNAGTPDKREQVTDRVIISNLPEQKSRIRSLLSTFLGNAGGNKLGVTQSEVWSVPRSLLARLSQTLRVFGCTVTRLGDDWNHILKRKGVGFPDPLSGTLNAGHSLNIIRSGMQTRPSATHLWGRIVRSDRGSGRISRRVAKELDHGVSSRLPAPKRAVGPLRSATVESAIT